LALCLPAAGPAFAAHAATAQTAATETIYHGNAWGSTEKRNQTVVSGESAPVSLGCRTRQGARFQNTIAGVHAPQNSFDTGTTIDTAAAMLGDNGAQISRMTSTVHDLSMFGGAIEADLVRTVSTTTRTGTQYSFGTGGSQFAGLEINGRAVGADAQHRVITVPGIGTVTLFDRSRSITTEGAHQTVNAIVVDVRHQNSQAVPIGTKIVVAHAASGLARGAGALGGRSFGSMAHVGDVVESGPSFGAYLPCLGTDGEVLSSSGANGTHSEQVPATTGNETNTARGVVKQRFAEAETTSRIDATNIGDGMITAELIKADALITKDNGVISIDTSGSHLGGLLVQGQGQSSSPDPNTVIDIPRVGKLTLYEVERGPNSVVVRMLHLQVLQDNPEFPLGTDLVLGYAKVAVR
jgi:hypothetical protein